MCQQSLQTHTIEIPSNYKLYAFVPHNGLRGGPTLIVALNREDAEQKLAASYISKGHKINNIWKAIGAGTMAELYHIIPFSDKIEDVAENKKFLEGLNKDGR